LIWIEEVQVSGLIPPVVTARKESIQNVVVMIVLALKMVIPRKTSSQNQISRFAAPVSNPSVVFAAELRFYTLCQPDSDSPAEGILLRDPRFR